MNPPLEITVPDLESIPYTQCSLCGKFMVWAILACCVSHGRVANECGLLSHQGNRFRRANAVWLCVVGGIWLRITRLTRARADAFQSFLESTIWEYLSASRKWVPEGIDACSSYLHLVAWGTAALMTIVVLVTQKVDASELSGICSVGNTDPNALLAFSLIPRSLLVFLGTCFVIAGFASMCRERDSFRRRVIIFFAHTVILTLLQGTDTSKLDKLMFKMGLFCLLYIFPAVTQVLCDIYAFNTAKRWYPTTIACKRSGGVEGGHCHRPHLPQIGSETNSNKNQDSCVQDAKLKKLQGDGSVRGEKSVWLSYKNTKQPNSWKWVL
ncbi:unnamed protein product [Cylicostephanus goldi]|uniref:G-protein coupled receptors family 2 profile 2 domain-containing protein n=1 Tax=Cylicostephanus goldi TaxID=71465 RepID=A0A3P6R5C6_CYLGO|nr:unnamed protein product [Cylicostephanus goldi]